MTLEVLNLIYLIHKAPLCKSNLANLSINMLGKSTQSDLFTIMIIIITLRN